MTLIVEGFDRFDDGDVPHLKTTERERDLLDILTGSAYAEGVSEVTAQFGDTVAISADGLVALVGDPSYHTAYIFARSDSNWEHRLTLKIPDVYGLGESLAASQNGDTLVIGAPTSRKIYILVRSGLIWVQQAEFTWTNGQFGERVDISADGNTVIVGDRGYRQVYVFTRSGLTWEQQGVLNPVDTGGASMFGYAVSISGDGSTVVVADSSKHALYVYTRTGSTWSYQASLRTSDDPSKSGLGGYVTTSFDGSTIASYASSKRACYVFIRSGSTWVQQAKLSTYIGADVSLSYDGDTLVCQQGSSSTREILVFNRSGSNWSISAVIQNPPSLSGGELGRRLSITGDGNTLIAGTYYRGSAYIFTLDGSNWVEEIELGSVVGGQLDPSFGKITFGNTYGRIRGKGFRYEKLKTGTHDPSDVRIPLNNEGWTTRIIGFNYKPVSAGGTTTVFRLTGTEDNSFALDTLLRIQAMSATPYLRFGNTNVGSGLITINQWHYVELVIDRSALTAELYVNGTLGATISISESDCVNGKFASFQSGPTEPLVTFDADDFYYIDDVGGDVELIRLGEWKIDLSAPESSRVTDFTPNTQLSNWQSVGGTPIDPNTFVSSDTAGHRDVHNSAATGNTGTENFSLFAVQTQTVLQTTSDSIPFVVGVGVGDSMKTEYGVATTTPTLVRNTMVENPVGGALDYPMLNNLISGYAYVFENDDFDWRLS